MTLIFVVGIKFAFVRDTLRQYGSTHDQTIRNNEDATNTWKDVGGRDGHAVSRLDTGGSPDPDTPPGPAPDDDL